MSDAVRRAVGTTKTKLIDNNIKAPFEESVPSRKEYNQLDSGLFQISVN